MIGSAIVRLRAVMVKYRDGSSKTTTTELNKR